MTPAVIRTETQMSMLIGEMMGRGWRCELFVLEANGPLSHMLEAKGIDSTNYINLASNLYRGIEQGQASGGQMVGGC